MSGDLGYAFLILPICVTLPVWYWLRRRSRNTLPYPPGPKGYPLIGNVLDFPTGVPSWEGFMTMAKQHGTDVLYFNVPGMDIVVLSTSEAVIDLLERRSAIYSDKPSIPMAELIGVEQWSIASMHYGPRWRMHRKLFNEFFNTSVVKKYDVNLVRAISNFLVRLHQHPEDFRGHIHHLTTSLPLSVSYGIQAGTTDNEFIRLFEELLAGVRRISVPGAFFVNFVPPLRYLPSWFPGAQFHRFAKKVREDAYNAIHLPFEHVADAFKVLGGIIESSIVSTYLEDFERINKGDIDKEVISTIAGMVYIGMSETTNAALSSFFLAMARNPDVMRTAQRQLDHVLGGDRLPGHSDIDNLPYVVGITKETLRWAPPLPIGTTHRLIEDDVYRGMFIPGGATIVENIWAICYDEAIYPDPHAYDPTRFLDKDGRINPSVLAPESRIFGSGRRICPGRDFAIRMLHLVIACTLTTFDIHPPVDNNGRPRIPGAEFCDTFTHDPTPFVCVLKPRSEKVIGLMHDFAANWN